MHEEQPEIACPLFQTQERVMKGITDNINNCKGIQEKAKFAEELQKEVEELLSCQDFKSESLDCKNCHFIANLRKRTVDLIIKAKKLA